MPRRLTGVDNVLGANSASWLWTLDRYDSYVQRGQREELAKELQEWFKQTTGGAAVTLTQARQWLDRVGSARQAAAQFESTASVPSGVGQYRQSFLSPNRPWVVRGQVLFIDPDSGETWRSDVEIALASKPDYAAVKAHLDNIGNAVVAQVGQTFGPGRSRRADYLGFSIRTLESLTWE